MALSARDHLGRDLNLDVAPARDHHAIVVTGLVAAVPVGLLIVAALLGVLGG